MLMYLGLAVVLFVLIILMRLMRSAEKGGGGRDGIPDVFKSVGGGSAFNARIGSGTGAPADPLTRLKQLQDMKNAGLITDVEYEAKRAEILEKI